MRIGIVGAGLGGLAAGALLARKGHAVAIMERAPQPRPKGAGLLLQPPGVRILDAVGGLAAVRSSAAVIARLDGRTPGGRQILSLDYADLGRGLHGLGVSRPSIWSSLMSRASSAGADVRPGSHVVGVHGSDGGSRIEVEGRAPEAFDLVLVASGTHCPLWGDRSRRVTKPYPWGALWATIDLPPGWKSDTLQQRCGGTATMAGILPIGFDDGRQRAAFYWSIRNDRTEQWRERPLEAWYGEIARTWPEAADLARQLGRGDVEHAVYRDVWADPPYHGSVVAIGDAAHGTSPQLGQGTTQAFRDAEDLADCLDTDAPLPDRLALYWAKRRKRTAYYRLASRLLTPAFQSSAPGLGLLRDAVAGPIGRIPFVRRQALLTLAAAKTSLWGSEAVP